MYVAVGVTGGAMFDHAVAAMDMAKEMVLGCECCHRSGKVMGTGRRAIALGKTVGIALVNSFGDIFW